MPKASTPSKKRPSRRAKPVLRKTYVALVLDSSGSMDDVRDDAIGGFNTNVDEIKQNADLGGETFVSLFTFGEAPDGKPRAKMLNQSPERLERLTRQTYHPHGNTPMLDGIGLALTSLIPHDVEGEDIAFLVTVITDGYENASREWTGDKLAGRIAELQDKGNWTITLIGANVDLDAIKQMTGIHQTVAYASSSVGTQNAMAAQASANSSYFAARSAGATAVPDMYAGNANLSDSGAVASLKMKARSDLAKARKKTPAVI